jgi:hypothetical protein
MEFLKHRQHRLAGAGAQPPNTIITVVPSRKAAHAKPRLLLATHGVVSPIGVIIPICQNGHHPTRD